MLVQWDASCEQQGGPTTTLLSAGTPASGHAAPEEQVLWMYPTRQRL